MHLSSWRDTRSHIVDLEVKELSEEAEHYHWIGVDSSPDYCYTMHFMNQICGDVTDLLLWVYYLYQIRQKDKHPWDFITLKVALNYDPFWIPRNYIMDPFIFWLSFQDWLDWLRFDVRKI